MKIALAFSGGGFRAAAFNLGALTYLNQVTLDGEPLLKKVVALSTVSGGTITGARYATGIKKGESVQQIYKALYTFFNDADVVSDSLGRLQLLQKAKGKRVQSLINAFADVYDHSLFAGDKFGLLLDMSTNPIHLKQISFNATEFSTGLQFRFQVAEPVISKATGKPITGKIGNQKNRIPETLAREIRMGDILAASSCFPGGFEPINFPDDFVLPNELVESYKGKTIGVMDGGIVDNQGIEPLLLAERRMHAGLEDGTNKIDLMIISDVASPYMEGFTASLKSKENWWRQLTLLSLRNATIVTALLSLAGVVGGFIYNQPAAVAAGTFVGTLAGLVLAVFAIVNNCLSHVRIIDMHKVENLLHVKLGVFELFLKNRVSSVMKLAGSVFMKRIRSLNYRAVYEDKRWDNRRIQNAIYELRKGEKWEKMKALPEELKPSDEIRKVTTAATRMSTTLWFKDEQKQNNILDKLIACGQYTMCWNLLEYIRELKQDATNTNDSHRTLMACEAAMLKDWADFQNDPLWLVREYEK